MNENIEENLEAVPQNFPQLLFTIHRQATYEIGKGNIDGFVQTVKTLHAQMSSFYDKKYLEAKAEIDKRRSERYSKIRGLPPVSFDPKSRNIIREWAMDLLGILSELEGRKGLLVERTSVVGDE